VSYPPRNEPRMWEIFRRVIDSAMLRRLWEATHGLVREFRGFESGIATRGPWRPSRLLSGLGGVFACLRAYARLFSLLCVPDRVDCGGEAGLRKLLIAHCEGADSRLRRLAPLGCGGSHQRSPRACRFVSYLVCSRLAMADS
jgi:hypothetical protein